MYWLACLLVHFVYERPVNRVSPGAPYCCARAARRSACTSLSHAASVAFSCARAASISGVSLGLAPPFRSWWCALFSMVIATIVGLVEMFCSTPPADHGSWRPLEKMIRVGCGHRSIASARAQASELSPKSEAHSVQGEAVRTQPHLLFHKLEAGRHGEAAAAVLRHPRLCPDVRREHVRAIVRAERLQDLRAGLVIPPVNTLCDCKTHNAILDCC